MTADRFSLVDRVALVTGASSGLGYHMAQVLAKAGASVAVGARRKDKLEQLVNEIVSAGGKAIAISMDVTNSESVSEGVNEIESALGIVDILVNNAGVSAPQYFLDVEESDWDYTFDTNVKGAWRVASEVSKRLVDHKKPGSIVNIASILSLATQAKQSMYATSKAAVAHLTTSMAAELSRYNIRVNALAPGYFLSEMNEEFFSTEKGQAYMRSLPTRRLGKHEELSGPLLLLASDAGSFINGIILPVDGGHLAAGR